MDRSKSETRSPSQSDNETRSVERFFSPLQNAIFQRLKRCICKEHESPAAIRARKNFTFSAYFALSKKKKREREREREEKKGEGEVRFSLPRLRTDRCVRVKHDTTATEQLQIDPDRPLLHS